MVLSICFMPTMQKSKIKYSLFKIRLNKLTANNKKLHFSIALNKLRIKKCFKLRKNKNENFLHNKD